MKDRKKTKLEYRRFRQGDEKKVLELQNKMFGVSKEANYLEWKYLQAPGGDHSIFLALDRDTVVGQSGGIPIRIKVGSKDVLSIQEVDFMILPEYRRGGTFLNLIKHSSNWDKERQRLNYGFPNKDSRLLTTKLYKFRDVCPILKQIKILDPTSFIQGKIKIKLISYILGHFARILLKFWHVCYNKTATSDEGIEICEINEFDQRFDSFWKQVADEYEIIVVRDANYLNWRYLEVPSSNYKIFAAQQNGQIRGFIVLSCTHEDILRGSIVDVLVSSGQPVIADMLIRRAISYFYDMGVAVITSWLMEHSNMFPILKKRGFMKRETPNDLVVRSFVSDMPTEYFQDKLKWYITIGDSDYY